MKETAIKEIGIFVAGMTPQIITETLYAFHTSKEPVHPEEIHIITTGTGRELIRKRLIEEGRLEEFCREFSLPSVLPEFHVIAGRSGEGLDDIRTGEDNEAVGDLIVELIRSMTGRDETRLHCSIAGGRKTMSFYLGSALGLFGRPWDRLYHVLVTPEFESHPDFYWKPKKDRIIEIKDSEGKVVKRLNTRDAEICLAELPFIRLREKIPLNGKGFRELVQEGQRDIDTASIPLPLSVNLNERVVYIGDISVEMVPSLLVVYLYFLRRKTERCLYPDKELCNDCTECFPLLSDLWEGRVTEAMARDYGRLYAGNQTKSKEFQHKWKDGFKPEVSRQHISKINRTIKEHLQNETLASLYTISSVGRYGSKSYGVRLEKGKIRIVKV